MRGISTSRVMTSGTQLLMCSAATNGSDAAAMTSIWGSAERIPVSACLTSAESSTIRTLIVLAIPRSMGQGRGPPLPPPPLPYLTPFFTGRR
jgi:hypothetical protein